MLTSPGLQDQNSCKATSLKAVKSNCWPLLLPRLQQQREHDQPLAWPSSGIKHSFHSGEENNVKNIQPGDCRGQSTTSASASCASQILSLTSADKSPLDRERGENFLLCHRSSQQRCLTAMLERINYILIFLPCQKGPHWVDYTAWLTSECCLGKFKYAQDVAS